MATRAERHRTEEQRKGRGATTRVGRSKPGAKPDARTRETKRAGRKATYALEEGTVGRPSRKSTRKSANRSKPDASLNAREQLKKNSPAARYRKARTHHARDHARAEGLGCR